MKKRENKLKSMIVEYGFACILFLVITVLCITGIQTAEQKYRDETLSSAKESILRGAINCYALEGVYPPDYEYLKENYELTDHREDEVYSSWNEDLKNSGMQF